MVGSAAVRQIQVRQAARRLLEAEVEQEPYRGTSWGRPYWEAIELYKESWEPYYVYRVGSMTTDFINVSDGVRATHRTAAKAGVPNRLVFLFGGSAAWGHGARDEATIPSWLARVAEEQGEPLDVRNYAESGWVNWQGITYLTQRLADGERPDTVIFYSGVNEVLSGRQWPQVRHPIWDGEAVPRAMADWALERSRPLARVWDYYRNTSYLWSLLVPRAPVLAASPPIGRSELAKRLAADYLAGLGLVEQMGRAFGFKTLFAWQLTVADKPSLTAPGTALRRLASADACHHSGHRLVVDGRRIEGVVRRSRPAGEGARGDRRHRRPRAHDRHRLHRLDAHVRSRQRARRAGALRRHSAAAARAVRGGHLTHGQFVGRFHPCSKYFSQTWAHGRP